MSRLLSWLLRLLPLALPCYLVRFSIGPLPTTVLEVFLIVLIGCYLWTYRLNGIASVWKKAGALRWAIAAFFIASFASIWWAPSVIAGLGLWRAYVLEPVIVFFIYLDCLERDITIKDLERSVFWLVILLSLWGIIEFLTGIGIPKPWNVSIAEGRRATGPFPYPNALALACVPISAYALAKWREQSSNLLAMSTFVFGVIACVVAKSDGGLIALAAVLWGVLLSFKRLRFGVLAMTVLGFGIIASTPALRVPVLKELRLENWSGYVRKKMWQDTWRLIKDHPVKGTGFAGYPVVFKPYQTTRGIEVFQYPHTIIFNFWTETGLFGLLSFMGMLLIVFFKSVSKRSLAGMAVLVALVVHGLVDVPYFKNDLSIIFYLLVALIWLSHNQEALALPSHQMQSHQENHPNE